MIRLAFALALLVAGFTAAGVNAQTQPAADPDLARIDSLVAAGNLDDARTALARWMADHPPGRGPAGSQAQALYLKGRLATDWKGAEDAYLSVVLGYPTSPQAPDALLLLGKGLLAASSTGSPSTAAIRAASYLERLINDYPGNPLRDEARLWLARAWATSGKADLGCGLLRQSLAEGTDPHIADAMRTDSVTVCAPDAAAATTPTPTPAATRDSAAVPLRDSTNAARDTTPVPPPATVEPIPPDRVNGRYTVQVAAMRSRDGADRIADSLRKAGFNARVVDLEDSGLIRVRVDTFASATDAEALAVRIRARGFDADVVSDVDREIRKR